MIANILVFLGVVGMLFLTSFWPVYLPDFMISGITNLLQPLFYFNEFVPVQTFFNDLAIFINTLLIYLIFNMTFGLIAIATGAGKPEIN